MSTQGELPWWKQPQNVRWYWFTSRWLYAGCLFLVVLTVVFGGIGVSASKVSVFGDSNLYHLWLVSCLVLCGAWPLGFLIVGFFYYRTSGARVEFTLSKVAAGLGGLGFFWWFSSIFFLMRGTYEFVGWRALFDLSLMPGVLAITMGVFHIIIAFVRNLQGGTQAD